MSFKILKPTKLRNFNKDIYGFDIETYDNNKKFLCASLYLDENNVWVFKDKRELIEFMKQKRFKDSYICATNLSFDFFGTFHNEPEEKEFIPLFRGSDLITTKTNIVDGGFKIKAPRKGQSALTFIDTMNFAKLSVEKLGNLINISKLEKPDFLGQYPKNDKEWEQMIEYNVRDSEVSKKGLEFLFNSFYRLGATPKATIASTAMSLFRNQYLKHDYFRHDINILLDQFNAYYGGRTEAFSRGLIKNYNYYDFNSLYPSVMINEFPDPNSKRICYKNSIKYIEAFEGVSNVDVFCPEMEYPYLPLRTDTKLLFPCGNFSGWYTHLELRRALELGYVIKRIRKTIYFKETCEPFRDYVIDLYNKRLEYKKQGSSMEYIVKILLNSLYGKFGQKFMNRDSWRPFDLTLDELNKLKDFERIGNYIRIKKDMTEPPVFCTPIWALYVTAYAREKMHKAILNSRPVYVDTDSLITKKEILTSNKLGKLKLEMFIKKGIIVKPKFYAFEPQGKKAFVKSKGIGVKLTIPDFWKLLVTGSVEYTKFMKFKESTRRGFIPNEIVGIVKHLNLEDEKRMWNNKFDYNELQHSKPLFLGEKDSLPQIMLNNCLEHKTMC